MATHLPNPTVLDHSSDAAFRVWATGLHDALIAIGFVQTADTGQINFTTVVRAVNTTAYAIYKTNDGLTDIYLKMEYGTLGTVTIPQTYIQCGTGTNGAGVINVTGSTTRTASANTYAPVSIVTPYVTRACGITGCWWVGFKQSGVAGGTFCGFALMRFANDAGAATSDGYAIYTHDNTGNTGNFRAQQVRTVTGDTGGYTTAFCLLPGGITSANTGTDIQFWKHFVAQPKMTLNPFVVTADTNIVLDGQTRSLTLLTGVTKTFILHTTMMKTCGVGAVATSLPMFPWQ